MSNVTKFPQTATGTDKVSGGDDNQATWNNPSNITASDNTYASTQSMHTLGIFPEHSAFLKATNFGFEIPETATIDGIVASVERKRTTENMQDYQVQLIKDGEVDGNDKATIQSWTASDVVVEYGGEEDLWGLEFTANDINSDSFGLAFSAKSVAVEETPAQVDSIRITVYYTDGTGDDGTSDDGTGSGGSQSDSPPFRSGFRSRGENALDKIYFPFKGNSLLNR